MVTEEVVVVMAVAEAAEPVVTAVVVAVVVTELPAEEIAAVVTELAEAEIAVVVTELAAAEIAVVVMELAAEEIAVVPPIEVDRVPVEVAADTIGINRKFEARVSGDHSRVKVVAVGRRCSNKLDNRRSNNRHRLK